MRLATTLSSLPKSGVSNRFCENTPEPISILQHEGTSALLRTSVEASSMKSDRDIRRDFLSLGAPRASECADDARRVLDRTSYERIGCGGCCKPYLFGSLSSLQRRRILTARFCTRALQHPLRFGESGVGIPCETRATTHKLKFTVDYAHEQAACVLRPAQARCLS